MSRQWVTERLNNLRLSPSFTPIRAGVLLRQCATGGQFCGACEDCRQGQSLQRQALDEREPSTIPSVVHEVLRSPGLPLDPTVRSFMESRFGHDFKRVQVHTDDRAVESARAMRANAYTVNHHIVFGAGQYVPHSATGRKLLAHELVHVIQQGGDRRSETTGSLQWGSANLLQEQEADRASDHIVGAAALNPQPSPLAASSAQLQRQPNPTAQLNLTIDEKGKVDLTLSGPDMPVVGNPTLGIRRRSDGSYDLLMGGKGKTVGASEIPLMLKGMMGSGTNPSTGKPTQEFRVPTCGQLRAASGTRFMTFQEYSVSQMISNDRLPMSPAIYDALVESCRTKPLNLEPPAPAPLLEPTPRTLPEGMEMA